MHAKLVNKNKNNLRLALQGHQIIGIEYVENAVVQFFTEQKIEYDTKEVKDFKLYSVNLHSVNSTCKNNQHAKTSKYYFRAKMAE